MAILLGQRHKYLLISIFFVIIIHLANSLPKEISITPSDDGNNVNGAQVYMINSIGTSIDNNQWKLETQENSQFNLRVHLDQSWSMDSILPTAITLQLHGSNVHYTNGTNLDLLLTVQLHSTNQNAYYTLLINLDNNGLNLVSPACTTDPITSMHQNDSYFDMEHNSNTDRKCNVMQNDANTCVYDEISETITNQWPYEFTITNYPNAGNGYNTITYGNNSIYMCAFNEEIKSDTEIEFWITPSQAGQTIKISQIDLQSYFLNDNPITTDSPTGNPITTSITPTTAPTGPTESTEATASTEASTSNISNVSATTSTEVYSDIITTLLVNDNINNGSTTGNTSILYIAVGISIIICVCCIIAFIFYKKQKGNNVRERNSVNVSMTPVERVGNVTPSDSDDSNENNRRPTDEMINNYLENQGIRDKEIEQILNEGTKYNVVHEEKPHHRNRDTFHTHLTDITAVNAMVIDDVVSEMADGPDIRETLPTDLKDDNTIA